MEEVMDLKSSKDRDLILAIWSLTTAVTNLNSQLGKIESKLDALGKDQELSVGLNPLSQSASISQYEKNLGYPNFTEWERNAIPTDLGLIFSPEDFYIVYGKTLRREYFTFDEAIELEEKILCPKGWRLPTAEEWRKVVEEYKNVDQLIASLKLSYTGCIFCERMRKYCKTMDKSLISNRGSYGNYWSSTAYSSNNAYNLVFVSSYVYPGTFYYNKYNGYAVRCVKDL